VFVNLHQPLPQSGTALVRVYDFLGRQWLESPVTQTDYLLELPQSLPTGVYILEVEYPNGRKATQRLMRL
jgi:hypothetical protein